MELVSVATDKEEQLYGVYVKDCFEALGFIDKIVQEASYLFEADYCIPDFDETDVKTFDYYKSIGEPMPRLTKPTLYTFNPKYVNITELADGYDGRLHFHGSKLVPPKLAEVVHNLLYDHRDGLIKFLDYENDEELISIDEEMEDLERRANELNTAEELDEKLRLLSLLQCRRAAKSRGEFYDVEKLKRLYEQLGSMLYLKTMDENEVPYGDYVTINQYKQNKKGKAMSINPKDAQ